MLIPIGPSLTSFLFLGLLHTHRTTHLDLRTVPYTCFNSWFFSLPHPPNTECYPDLFHLPLNSGYCMPCHESTLHTPALQLP